jgi:hypothetical protein
MRASEQIASESMFLRLFGPGVLDLLQDLNPLASNLVIRSAPGGGKTSLLRVFTPASLVAVYVHRNLDEYRDLYAGLTQLGAVDESGPKLLAIMVSCSKSYAALEDLAIEPARRQRLFFALLNCRIILAGLRGALSLKELDYPDDLHRLSLQIDSDVDHQMDLPPNWGGRDVYEWAKGIETEIANSLDSLDASAPDAPGHENLLSLDLLQPSRISIEGERLVPSVIVMFDDVHQLASTQRTLLGKWLTGSRIQVPTWIAERLEALDANELLDQGAKQGRDYQEPARTLEKYWRQYPQRFEKIVSNIADKRAREARSIDVGSLEGYLTSGADTPSLESQMAVAAKTIQQRLFAKHSGSGRFQDWLESSGGFPNAPSAHAIAWKGLEILIERESKKTQLAFDLPLTPNELARKDDSPVRAAAELMLSQEFGTPYYYGFARLVTLASSNIEQFLAVAGDLFEEVASAAVLGRLPQLSPERQHAIIKKTAQRWWEDDLMRAIPMAADVRRLIESIGRFARWETYKPNAPYAPGVTGVSITMSERDALIDPGLTERRPDLKRLRDVLSVCIAHNILEFDLDRSQGYERRMVLYLNRLLCVHFDLPLQYGGWRPKRPDELAQWMSDGYRAPSGELERLL